MALPFSSTVPRRRLQWLLAALALAACLLLPDIGSAQTPPADAGWLDQPLASNWNQAGMDLPTTVQMPLSNPRCATGAALRWAETPQDQAVVDAGWSLYGAYRAGWGLVVVDAASGYDGMCRPLGFQSFVFSGTTFAGTISPVPMNSRETGQGTVTAVQNGGISARFLRYAATDALCCPSLGAVDMTYSIDQTPAGPVLTPASSYTEPDNTKQ